MGRTRIVAAVIAAVFALSPTSTLERGATADGWLYVSGGIGLGERDELAQARKDFSLRVASAARGSGAFLSSVQVTITDAGGQRLFQRALAGPLLLIDLLPGQYVVEGDLRGKHRQSRTAIGAADRHEIYFHFDVPAEVLPKDQAQR